MTFYFSTKALGTRRQWSDAFKIREENYFSLKFCALPNYSLREKNKNKSVIVSKPLLPMYLFSKSYWKTTSLDAGYLKST